MADKPDDVDPMKSVIEAVSNGEPQVEELTQILRQFNLATTQLQASHEILNAQVKTLTGELSRKNDALEASLCEVNALKNYLANILESITDGVIAIDPDRRVVALNQAAGECILRLTMDQVGQPIAEALPSAAQELGALLVRALDEETRFTNVEISIPGEPQKTLSVSASPIRNEAGQILGAVESFRDLTGIKALEARAARHERLAALGEMAAGVAHEIRNPLGGIELYASSLKRRFKAETRDYEAADQIIAAAGNLNRIVTDMLTFTRHRDPNRRPVAAGYVVRSALDLAAHLIESKAILVEQHDETGGEKFSLDPETLTQAFLNVIQNAVHVMELGGSLWVRVGTEDDPALGRILVVTFGDSGPGVPEEVRDSIFNPFFTTRKDGTGLGLAIVHKIVQDHGGTLHVEDRPGGGAVFVFRIPVPHPVREM